MEVILLERVEKLGQMGEVVEVRAGYARNYLLPQGKALRATDDNRKRFDERRSQLEATNLTRRQEAEAVADKMEGMVLPLIRQASESDQLYGSVTARDLHAALAAEGVTVERRQVLLEQTIKAVGLHTFRVALHPEVIVEVTANVARSPDELEIQARGERPADVAERQAEEEARAAAEELFETGAGPEEGAPPRPADGASDEEDDEDRPSETTLARRRR